MLTVRPRRDAKPITGGRAEPGPHWPGHLNASLSALLLCLVLAVGACSGAAPTAAPSDRAPSPGQATASDTAESVSAAPVDATPEEGDCVETDVPIASSTDLERFGKVRCDDPDARYRVLLVTGSTVMCPALTGYTVTRYGQVFCLTDQLVDDPSLVTVDQLAVGDCVALDGDLTVEQIRRLACDDAAAEFTVVKRIDGFAEADCPADADQELTNSGIQRTTVCLAAR